MILTLKVSCSSSQPVSQDPCQVFTLRLLIAAKLRYPQNNFMLGGQHTMKNCIKGSQQHQEGWESLVHCHWGLTTEWTYETLPQLPTAGNSLQFVFLNTTVKILEPKWFDFFLFFVSHPLNPDALPSHSLSLQLLVFQKVLIRGEERYRQQQKLISSYKHANRTAVAPQRRISWFDHTLWGRVSQQRIHNWYSPGQQQNYLLASHTQDWDGDTKVTCSWLILF